MCRTPVLAAALTPPFVVAAALLGVAGVLKLRAGSASGRALGAGEVVLGALALAAPSPVVAALVAAAYAGFSAHVARLLTTADGAPCGCLGATSAPASAAHLALDAVAAVVAALAAATAPHGIAWIAARPAGTASALALGAAAATYAAYLVLAALPGAWRAYGTGAG